MLPLNIKLLLLASIAWSMVWKGIGLWRAGRNTHLVWFIILLVVNTLGILELIYILAFSRKAGSQISSGKDNK
ncbi:MAG: hypothetical protein HY529_01195 [Chloroflexi bacterium]|nr:hypothetical protein [Chloroflexota bacterium]